MPAEGLITIRSAFPVKETIDRFANAARAHGLTIFARIDHAGGAAQVGMPFAANGTHLDALASRQHDDGGWPIAWTPPSPAAEFEWRGRWTLEALLCLRAYGRI